MAWTAADLDAIDAAIRQAAQGKTVTFADRSYTAQELDDLLALRAVIAAAVNTLTHQSSRFAAFSKGV